MVSPAGSGFGTLDTAPRLVFSSVVPGVTPWRILFLCDGFHANDRNFVVRSIRQFAEQWLSEAPFYGQGVSVQFWLRFAASTDAIITYDRLRNGTNVARTWYGFAFTSGVDNVRVAADIASSVAMLGIVEFDTVTVLLNSSQGWGGAGTTNFACSIYDYGVWAHELGHVHRPPPIAGLADEYWGTNIYNPAAGEPGSPNLTANYARPNKWDSFITAAAYPTKLSPNLVAEWTESMADGYKPGDVGGFEGGGTCGQGLLRPAVHCRMHDGADQPWCKVCANALRSNIVLPFSSQVLTQRIGDYSLSAAPGTIADRWMPPAASTSVPAASSIGNNYLLIPRDGWLRAIRIVAGTAMATDTLTLRPEINAVATGSVVALLPTVAALTTPLMIEVAGGSRLSTRITQSGVEGNASLFLHVQYLFEATGGF
jgi:hypothetical protein